MTDGQTARRARRERPGPGPAPDQDPAISPCSSPFPQRASMGECVGKRSVPQCARDEHRCPPHAGKAPGPGRLPAKVSYLFQEDFSVAVLVDFFEEVGGHLVVPYEHVPLRQAGHQLQQLNVKHQHGTAWHFSVCLTHREGRVSAARQWPGPPAALLPHPGLQPPHGGQAVLGKQASSASAHGFPNGRQ